MTVQWTPGVKRSSETFMFIEVDVNVFMKNTRSLAQALILK